MRCLGVLFDVEAETCEEGAFTVVGDGGAAAGGRGGGNGGKDEEQREGIEAGARSLFSRLRWVETRLSRDPGGSLGVKVRYVVSRYPVYTVMRTENNQTM